MTNGSTLARLAYLKDDKWTSFGSVVYFRSHDVRIRLRTIPLWAMINDKWMLGTFSPAFKVEEAPYLSGDVIVKGLKADEVIKIGRVETYERPDGTVVHYMLKLDALPAAQVVVALKETEVEKKAVWLTIVLDDKEGA